MENMNWDLGDRTNIKFWKDTWSTLKKPIINQIDYPLNFGEKDITVSNFIKKGIWDFGLLVYATNIYATFILDKI